MSGQRRLDPDELGSARQAELDEAMAAARWLDDAAGRVPVSPGAAFADRVMGAIAGEPTPAPAGFLAPLRRRGVVRGFVASVNQAWASVGGAGRPMLVRAPALAYVLVVAIAGTSLAGVATVGVAGALGIFDAKPSQSAPPPETPGPTLAPVPTSAPTESAPPSGESAPPPSGEPSASPDESDDHGGSRGPEESDDHGGTSGPGSSGSGSDDDSGSDDGSPTDTPRPTGTPKPTETPH